MSEDIKKGQEAKRISELAILLSENPKIEQEVREIIDYHLKGGVDRTTYGKMGTGLEMLLGTSVTILITRCCQSNDNKVFEQFKEEIGGADVDKVLPFLQYLTAIYGSEMKEAYRLFNEIPEDWRSSTITVYREEEEKEKEEDIWFINIRLRNLNSASIGEYVQPKFFLQISYLLWNLRDHAMIF